MDSLLREEQVELAVTCAVSILGIRAGLTPIQQSGFNTPWVKAPDSQEEQFHQDLIWVYRVLPPIACLCCSTDGSRSSISNLKHKHKHLPAKL